MKQLADRNFILSVFISDVLRVTMETPPWLAAIACRVTVTETWIRPWQAGVVTLQVNVCTVWPVSRVTTVNNVPRDTTDQPRITTAKVCCFSRFCISKITFWSYFHGIFLEIYPIVKIFCMNTWKITYLYCIKLWNVTACSSSMFMIMLIIKWFIFVRYSRVWNLWYTYYLDHDLDHNLNCYLDHDPKDAPVNMGH